MDAISQTVAQFNAADLLWIAGAVVLVILAFKVVAKVAKFVLFVVAVLAALAFLVSIGVLPGVL